MKFRFNRTCADISILLISMFNLCKATLQPKCLKLLKLEAKFDIVHESMYEKLEEIYPEDDILVFNYNERIIKHLKLAKDEIAVVKITQEGNIYEVFNVRNILEHLIKQDKDSTIYFFNNDFIEIVYALKDKGYWVKILLYHELVGLYTFTSLNRHIRRILKELLHKGGLYILDSEYAKNLGIYTEKTGIIETHYIKSISYDPNLYANSVLLKNHTSLEDVKFMNLFNDFSVMFKDSFKSEKKRLAWCDAIIDRSFELLLKYKILKKEISVAQFPEIISLLFPIPFIKPVARAYFQKYEIAKFCLSFGDIQTFIYYPEFFNDSEVKAFKAQFERIYFSHFVKS